MKNSSPRSASVLGVMLSAFVMALPQALGQNTAPVIAIDQPVGGYSQIASIAESVNLAATATDDGLPDPPAALTYTWSKASGPGVATFGNPALEDTTVSFDTAGLYELKLTVSDGELSSSKFVVVNANASSQTRTLADYQFTHISGSLPAGWNSSSAPGAYLTASNCGITGATFANNTANMARCTDTATTGFSTTTNFMSFRLTADTNWYFDFTDALTEISFQIDRVSGDSPQQAQMQIFAGTGADPIDATTGTLVFTSSLGSSTGLLETVTDTGAINTVNSTNQYTQIFVQVQWRSGAVTPASSAWTFDNFRIKGALVPVGSGGGGPGTLGLTSATYQAAENAGSVVLNVSRVNGSDGAASVDFATSNGTATAGSDYTSNSGTLNWADGDSADKQITITLTDDLVYEGDETFTVTLSNATTAALGTPSVATVTILENETNTAPVIALVSPLDSAASTLNLSDKLLLDANVSDDGQPGPYTVAWTQVSGPEGGVATFGNASAEDTLVSFDIAGLYTLRITANDGLLSATKDIVVHAAATGANTGVITLANFPFTHPAGSLPTGWNKSSVIYPDLSVTNVGITGTTFTGSTTNQVRFGDTATNSFSTTDNFLHFTLTARDGRYFDFTDPLSEISLRLQRISGDVQSAQMQIFAGTDATGTLLFTSSTASSNGTTTITQTGAISDINSTNQYSSLYVQVQWRSDTVPANPSEWSFDDFVIKGALAGSGNLAPVTNAGTDNTVAANIALVPAGSATDDGKPATPGALSYLWSKVSGPGNVVFSDSTSATSIATFDAVGEYVLQVLVTDGAAATADTVTITVTTGGGLTAAEQWRQLYFGQTANTGNGANSFDADFDGIINLLERAAGTIPTDGGSAARPTVSNVNVSGTLYPAITYRQRAGGSGGTGVNYTVDGMTYTVEYDADLAGTWGSGGVTVVSTRSNTPAAGIDTVTVRLNTPISGTPKQFIRLRIIADPQ